MNRFLQFTAFVPELYFAFGEFSSRESDFVVVPLDFQDFPLALFATNVKFGELQTGPIQMLVNLRQLIPDQESLRSASSRWRSRWAHS